MNRLFVALLLTLGSLFANGQTVNQNNVLKVESLGWNSSRYVIKVTNKANCLTTIRIQYDMTIKDTTLSALAVATIYLDGVTVNTPFIRVKRISGASCMHEPSNSWVYISLSTNTLPIKFKSISAIRTGANTVKVNFETEEDATILYYVVKFSLDGKTYQEAAIVMPDGVVGGKQYTVTIQLRK